MINKSKTGKMISQLNKLEEERKELSLILSNFHVEPPPTEPPSTEINVQYEEGKLVRLKFQNNKCVEAGPGMGWAKDWPWPELLKYFRYHGLEYQPVL